MVAKRLEDRITETFAQGKPEREYADRYLDTLLENYSSTQERARRIGVTVVFLVVAFFLFSTKNVGELSVGPFKITHVSTLVTFIPAAISFYLYEFLLNGYWNSVYEVLRDVLVEQLYPTFFANDLQTTLRPGLPYIEVVGRTLPVDARGARTTFLESLVDTSYEVVAFFGPLAFLVYAYLHLFNSPRHHTLLLVLSVAVSVVNLIRGLAFFVRSPSNYPGARSK